jgi:hypothetical protein
MAQGTFVSQGPKQGLPDKLRFVRETIQLLGKASVRLEGDYLFFLLSDHGVKIIQGITGGKGY